jgi:hypothetical protein
MSKKTNSSTKHSFDSDYDLEYLRIRFKQIAFIQDRSGLEYLRYLTYMLFRKSKNVHLIHSDHSVSLGYSRIQTQVQSIHFIPIITVFRIFKNTSSITEH